MSLTTGNKNETASDEPLNPEPETGLSPRHERFCHEYLKDFNATAAAKRAGYSPVSAYNTGYRILNLPAVQQFLAKEQTKINADLTVASKAVSKELMTITFMERGEFLDDNGDLKNPKDLPEHLRAAVQVSTKKIKTEDKVTTVTTYNLFNKIQMLEKISKRALSPAAAVPVAPEPEYEDLGNGLVVEV